MEGTYYETNYLAASDTAENKKFVAAYKKKTGNETDSQAANGYGGMMVLAEALKIAGPNADRDKVRQGLGQVHDVPSVYGTGRYSSTRIGCRTFRTSWSRSSTASPRLCRWTELPWGADGRMDVRPSAHPDRVAS